MTTITLPDELEARLAEAAKRQGTTLELLAIEGLRRMYAPAAVGGGANGGTLADFLKGYVGTVAGSGEPWSERTGQRFGDMLVEKQQRHPT